MCSHYCVFVEVSYPMMRSTPIMHVVVPHVRFCGNFLGPCDPSTCAVHGGGSNRSLKGVEGATIGWK